MEALGASPVSMAWTECYTAMQQGTIDAVENSTPIITSNGFNELAKYYAFTKHFIVSDPVFMSKVVYDALPRTCRKRSSRPAKPPKRTGTIPSGLPPRKRNSTP
jgi:TRAP-type C4-dicarboxylate transport system substrate-binding protein